MPRGRYRWRSALALETAGMIVFAVVSLDAAWYVVTAG
jgi:hypothetical protein